MVNNAAIVPLGGFLVTEGAALQSAADFRLALEVNLVGAFLGMAAVLPIMRTQRSDSVINISSIAGLAPRWGHRPTPPANGESAG